MKRRLGLTLFGVDTQINWRLDNVPVTHYSPVFHPVPSPIIIDNHGHQVADPGEQSEGFSKETVDQAADIWPAFHISKHAQLCVNSLQGALIRIKSNTWHHVCALRRDIKMAAAA